MIRPWMMPLHRGQRWANTASRRRIGFSDLGWVKTSCLLSTEIMEVLNGEGGLSRRLFPVRCELLQALEHRHERHVLFARLDQPLDDGRLLRQNLVNEILHIEARSEEHTSELQ